MCVKRTLGRSAGIPCRASLGQEVETSWLRENWNGMMPARKHTHA